MDPRILSFFQTYDVRVLPTGEAEALYNELLAEGRRVAMHHRTGD